MTAQTLDEQNDEDPVYTAADVLDANGSPKGSNGGKDSVNADDPDADWSFESATMLDTSLNGQMTLILKKGTFDFRGSTVRCPVKIASSSAKLLGGTFTDIVCNTSGSYECINGVFLKRPEKDVDGGNVTGALRCVEMYTDSAIGDLSYTVNGKPLEGNEFYYMSYDESDGYKQEIALTCSGESTDLIKSWNVSEAYGTESIISRGRSLIRDAYGKGHTCTISVSSNDITQLHITVSGSVSTYMFLKLTAQTTADPDEAYKATVPCATLYTEDDTGARQPLTDTSKVKPGTKVYIEYDEDAAKEQYGENFIFNGWELTGSVSLGEDANLTDESGWFTMPDDDVTLKLIVPDPDVPGEDPGDSSSVSPDGVAGAPSRV